MLKKLIIYTNNQARYTLGYDQHNDLSYFFHESRDNFYGGIFFTRVTKFIQQNRLAFIDYMENNKQKCSSGVLNWPQNLTNLQSGTSLICQMTWPGDSNKQAKFSSDVKYLGKYVILLSQTTKHYFSKDVIKTNELVSLAQKYTGRGIIFRSAINGLDNLDLVIQEIILLNKQKVEVESSAVNLSMPKQLMVGTSNYMGLLRNLELSDELVIEVNDESIFNSIKPYVDLWQIDCLDFKPKLQIELPDNLINRNNPFSITVHNINLLIHNLSGINLIDVNGLGSKLTFYKINYLAIDEIVKQIKLLDLTGIILIDFIKNMTIREEEQLCQKLTDLLVDDWRQNIVLGFTKAGITEIIRNK